MQLTAEHQFQLAIHLADRICEHKARTAGSLSEPTDIASPLSWINCFNTAVDFIRESKTLDVVNLTSRVRGSRR